MEETLTTILEYATMVVAGCSGISTFLPTTKDKVLWDKVSKILTIAPTFIKPVSAVYGAVVGIINILGCNFGKAKNLIGNETCDSKKE